MSIMKEMFIEAYDELVAEAEESGNPITKELEDKLADKAMDLSRDRFADMCDAAHERLKYEAASNLCFTKPIIKGA